MQSVKRNDQMGLFGKLVWVLLTTTVCFGASAAGGSARHQSGRSAAEQFLRAVYAKYQADGDGVSANDRAVYDSRLLTLMRADREAAGKGYVGWLDFDPLCACQDFDIRAVKIAFLPAGNRWRDAEVRFRNLDQDVTLHLELRFTPVGWRVADVSSPSWGGSLRDRLRREIQAGAR
jgi:hypothetical protein